MIDPMPRPIKGLGAAVRAIAALQKKQSFVFSRQAL
jgi:hypothetical protein